VIFSNAGASCASASSRPIGDIGGAPVSILLEGDDLLGPAKDGRIFPNVVSIVDPPP
jgi:hypothetical protein